MAELFTIQSLVALVTLTILEIVLGIDNIIFLAIVTEDVPEDKREFVRRLGLGLALIGRIAMVLGISWLLGLDKTLFTLAGQDFSMQDVILLAGGLFLTYKAVTEIYRVTELKEDECDVEAKPVQATKRGFTSTHRSRCLRFPSSYSLACSSSRKGSARRSTGATSTSRSSSPSVSRHSTSDVRRTLRSVG